MDRLEAVPELSLAYLAEDRVSELSDIFRGAAEKGEPWHEEAFRAELFVVLGDLAAEYEARRRVYEQNPDEVALIDRLWDLAVNAEDADGILHFSREMAEKSGERVHVLDHYRVLIRQGKDEALRGILEKGEESLFSIRELFSEFFRNDKMDALSGFAAAAKEQQEQDWQPLFALGEYFLFEQDVRRAREYFRAVVALPPEEAIETVQSGFPRLNRVNFSRYAAMRTLALTSGSYGSEANLDYSFLGMPDRFNVGSQNNARDAALTYWKHMALEEGTSNEFLEELAVLLADSELPYGERILAMGMVGAPRYMMVEIDRYLGSDIRDPETDRFILRAVNRYAGSLEAFPELRRNMIAATRRVSERLGEREGATEELVRQRMNMLNRLGDRETALREGRERMEALSGKKDAEHLWEKLNLAFQIEDLPAAEATFAELRGSGEGRELIAGRREEGLYLHFATVHLEETGDRDAALEYMMSYVRALREGAGTSGGSFFPVRSWWGTDSFPPANPYWDGETMESLYESLGALLTDEGFVMLGEAIEAVAAEYSAGERGSLRFLETCLLWWRGDVVGARVRLNEGVNETQDPYLQFLAAFVSARDQRIQQANAMLVRLEEHDDSAFQRAALRFFMARDAGERAKMAEAVESLVEGEAANAERIGWASVLLEEDFKREAAALLAQVRPDELDLRSRDAYREAILVFLRRSGQAERGVLLARESLQRELADGFFQIDSSLRRAALRVLEAAGEIPVYQEALGEAMDLAAQAFNIKLLQAEAAPYGNDGSGGSSRRELLDEAVLMRPEDFQERLEYARWLHENGYSEEAVSWFDRLLEEDAPEVLVYGAYLIEVYENAGALERLTVFFEPWEIPEARSMDEFYGIQPTNHFLESLGTRLKANGAIDAAIDAWRKGVEINPVRFSESMRVDLIAALWEKGEEEEAFSVLRDYLFRENPPPELWVVQPFFSVVPRWLDAGGSTDSGWNAPLLDMIAPMKDNGELERLVRRARAWRDADTAGLAQRGFYLTALALARDDALEDELRVLAEGGVPAFEGRYGRTFESILRWIEGILEDWPEADEARRLTGKMLETP